MLSEPWGGYQRDLAQGEDVTGHVKHDTTLNSLANIDLSVPQLSQEQDFNYAIQGHVTSRKSAPTVAPQQGPTRGTMDLSVPHLTQEQVDELFAFNKCTR